MNHLPQKYFSSLLDSSRATASSLRGVPPSERIRCTFALMDTLQATQRKLKKGVISYASASHDLEHFLLFPSLNVLVLL